MTVLKVSLKAALKATLVSSYIAAFPIYNIKICVCVYNIRIYKNIIYKKGMFCKTALLAYWNSELKHLTLHYIIVGAAHL